MSALETFLEDPSNFWIEEDAMNALQQAGIISDECIYAEDVADVDCEKAIAWLKENRE